MCHFDLGEYNCLHIGIMPWLIYMSTCSSVLRLNQGKDKVMLWRPLQNAPFCPIPASGSNFNPQNTQCIPACPVGPADRTGVVKIFAFLGLEQN